MEPESGARAVELAAAGNVDDVHVLPDASKTGSDVRAYYYACRHCRVRLFDAAEVLPHDPQEGANKTFKFRRGGPLQSDGALGDVSSGPLSAAELCTSLFLDPDQTPWVAEDMREANSSGAVVQPDTIYCRNPRCRAKLGMQSWAGSQCSCGAWITPAFRIHASAVDKMLDVTPTSAAHATFSPH
ncbi:conserved hypothetical protein [Leishmania infantum JPCM5]|uniref:protein-tyrosine-phosphatase n=3 Tax=Leishmania donovani species complex TaxID=38574 RepID=A4HU47_LEIIN|nr:conserved hypothetical protein [Leishmania infantum JPCM5]XP_003858809.1 hypothetical protein, conserved [Leishmania donovani]CAC9455346.1 hypothetical_protein_-__conserved [Leishmania infantum]AYU76572.1 hypothetical protein LdCL_090019500 [Leishmania donovani]CAM65953.1 conserved hypothetical protein [Leishmania infantum JPCM5]CBZ32089.1 hypothetical protein, conserved [Leishmania donovani]SUZ39583.1 hypothetical_protein_-__conserved [Leishmania infantum]|eukprot:XP_001463588.1 conserved hypothetical protein [Leishmania infantum JPCM5]